MSNEHVGTIANITRRYWVASSNWRGRNLSAGPKTISGLMREIQDIIHVASIKSCHKVYSLSQTLLTAVIKGGAKRKGPLKASVTSLDERRCRKGLLTPLSLPSSSASQANVV